MGGQSWCLTLLLLLLCCKHSSSRTPDNHLLPGSSLSVETPSDVLISPNREFSAGFLQVGQNAYCFSIWFTESTTPSHDQLTVVWMANREGPVNGRRSKLKFRKSGDLVLTDAGQTVFWSTDAYSNSTELKLLDTGNLVLTDRGGVVLWQSFASPTDTLLPGQALVKTTKLVSSRSQTNHSSGKYELFFDDNNTLRLLYRTPEITSIFWPDPWLRPWEANREIFNDSRVAVLDSSGWFNSSDSLSVSGFDLGAKLQRRLTIDPDGNLRLYSRRRRQGNTWVLTWQAILQPCKIHGICGANSLCTYVPKFGRKCSCIPGYKMVKETDQTLGCEPDFTLSCDDSRAESTSFAHLPNVEFYGYDKTMFFNYTLKQCKAACLDLCSCAAVHYKFDGGSGAYFCYIKLQLRNGYHTPGFNGDIYLKLPKTTLSSQPKIAAYTTFDRSLDCNSTKNVIVRLDRVYHKKHLSSLLEFLFWFAIGIAIIEVIVVFTVWFFVIRSQENSDVDDIQRYIQAATGFRKFGYSELKKATRNFSEEIGTGAGGTVYKARLPDNRVAAVKRLRDTTQGEVEFLAEVSIIGRLNHMNLIEMWGYCAEGKHRLLVYEYMEHGSVAENLASSKALDWKKRFEIALGTAKGLAYLHDECLEWVLHCDVKPQNILLGSDYEPKVADFGLSKLLNRSEIGDKNSNFSRIRGTRGYMAPEWVYNLPITSKVDVYSYGVVVLEILTGKNPSQGVDGAEENGVVRSKTLVPWVRERIAAASTSRKWIEEIIDPVMEGNYKINEIEILINVALRCVEEDKDLRPTMRQVVEMILRHENHI